VKVVPEISSLTRPPGWPLRAVAAVRQDAGLHLAFHMRLELAAGVDDVGDPGDVPAGVADQVQDRVGDVGRLQRRDRELVQRARGDLEVLPGRVGQIGAEQLAAPSFQ